MSSDDENNRFHIDDAKIDKHVKDKHSNNKVIDNECPINYLRGRIKIYEVQRSGAEASND